jgi:uncharacterized protein YjiS (DUF1127 family)
MTYKITTNIPDINIFVVFIISGLIAAGVGFLFGLPSLRIKGFYLAVATLASQFFLLWQRRYLERQALANFDDHRLDDIGLTREDVAREIAKPFWRA